MDSAAKILIIGGVLNLAYGLFTGFFLAKERMNRPEAPKYLIFAHVGPLMQGPMLLSLVFAINFSPLSSRTESLAAWLLVAGSMFLATKDTFYWIQGIRDEFAQRPPSGIVLGSLSAISSTLGLAILVFGIFRGL
jgi:hypothetical protein